MSYLDRLEAGVPHDYPGHLNVPVLWRDLRHCVILLREAPGECESVVYDGHGPRCREPGSKMPEDCWCPWCRWTAKRDRGPSDKLSKALEESQPRDSGSQPEAG